MRRRAVPVLLCCMVPSVALAMVEETNMVAMRDGVHLETIVYRPSRSGSFPSILIRTPYGNEIDQEAAEIVADGLGYVLVSQDTRGRYESEGTDDVFQSDGWGEHQDGYDTIDWVIDQSWSDGQAGMIGASALGITTYLAAGTLHPALKAAHVGIAPWVFYNVVYQGGAYRTALVSDWLEGQDASYMIETYQAHPMYDETWEGLDMRTVEDQLTIPIYHYGGWHDVFTEGPLEGFSGLQGGGANGATGYQRLLMGPWTHIDEGAFSQVQGELTYPENSIIPLSDANPIAWFDRYLKGRAKPVAENLPVRFYVMGDVDNPESPGNRWEEAEQWPLPSDARALYLGENGELSWAAPQVLIDPVSYVYDPADPCPTIGGHELSLPAGPRDQQSLADRSDVLVYQTDPLSAPFKVVGKVKMVLYVSSDAPDTDFTVRLNDVYPDGRAMLVTDGILKARYRDGMDQEVFLEPGEVANLEIELGSTAQVFDTGHRIQVMVSSSNYRRFEASKNLDGSVWTDEEGVPAVNSVYFDEMYPSHLVLPQPRPDSSRAVLNDVGPSPRTVSRALAKLHRGRRLSSADRDALSFEGGRRLLELVNNLPF